MVNVSKESWVISYNLLTKKSIAAAILVVKEAHDSNSDVAWLVNLRYCKCLSFRFTCSIKHKDKMSKYTDGFNN